MVVIRDLTIHIDLTELLRSQGAELEKLSLRESVRLLYKEAISEAASLVEPAIVYELCAIREIRHSQIVLGTGQVFRSHLIASVLGSAEEVALVVCTIGDKLEKMVSQYFADQQAARAVVLDAVGIEAVRQVSEEASRHVEAEAGLRGLKASIPINPGISSLCSLEEQKAVFQVVAAQNIGVRLTPSLVMVPLKSTSMIIGIGADVRTRDNGTQCDFCSLRETCRQRRGRAHQV